MYAYCEQKNWKLTRTKYSDYSKLIMALTSIGIDAQNVGGHNLFDYLSDYENVRMQGIKGPIWALIGTELPSVLFYSKEQRGGGAEYGRNVASGSSGGTV